MFSFIKKRISPDQKRNLKRLLRVPFVIGRRKVFCISMQRTGTTSVGTFLNDHGIRTSSYTDSAYYHWGYYRTIGDFESIFNNKGFKSFQGYQDSPWWAPDFYKILFHRFPDAKFILFTRNSDDWFDSMIKHSKGKNPGNTFSHSKIYQRMDDYFNLIGDKRIDFNFEAHKVDNLLELEGHREHYRKVYENYNREAMDYFHSLDKSRLIVCELNDPQKWNKVGDFLGIKVDKQYQAHSNKSK